MYSDIYSDIHVDPQDTSRNAYRYTSLYTAIFECGCFPHPRVKVLLFLPSFPSLSSPLLPCPPLPSPLLPSLPPPLIFSGPGGSWLGGGTPLHHLYHLPKTCECISVFAREVVQETNVSHFLLIYVSKVRMYQRFCSFMFQKFECITLFAHR